MREKSKRLSKTRGNKNSKEKGKRATARYAEHLPFNHFLSPLQPFFILTFKTKTKESSCHFTLIIHHKR
jgi:hypothetical protein